MKNSLQINAPYIVRSPGFISRKHSQSSSQRRMDRMATTVCLCQYTMGCGFKRNNNLGRGPKSEGSTVIYSKLRAGTTRAANQSVARIATVDSKHQKLQESLI